MLTEIFKHVLYKKIHSKNAKSAIHKITDSYTLSLHKLLRIANSTQIVILLCQELISDIYFLLCT